MEEIKISGIVIKSVDYKDSDKIITIFSPEKGLIKARVRGVKKKNAKLVFAVQAFAFIEFVLVKKGDYYTVINASSVDQFFDITSNFDNYILCIAMLEIIEKTVRENEIQYQLFLLLLEAIKSICYAKSSAMYVFVKFLIESMKFLGFAITIDNCAACGKVINEKFYTFSYDFNGLLCSKCSKNNDYLELTVGEYAVLKNINMTKIDDLFKLNFASRDDVVSIIKLLCKLFRLHTDEEISSLKQFL